MYEGLAHPTALFIDDLNKEVAGDFLDSLGTGWGGVGVRRRSVLLQTVTARYQSCSSPYFRATHGTKEKLSYTAGGI